MRSYVTSAATAGSFSGQTIAQSPYAAAVRDGSLTAFGGQASGAPGLERQLDDIVADIATILGAARATLADLVKLVVFYRADCGFSETRLRTCLASSLATPRAIAITCVALRRLARPESLVEVEGYALTSPVGGELERRSVTLTGIAPPGDGFCHGLRCGQFILISAQTAKSASGEVVCEDLPRQNRQVLENIERILQALDAGSRDIVKVNTWRLPPPDPAQYLAAAQDRFAYFAAATPAVTGITVPDVAGDGALISIDAWAMRDVNNGFMPKQVINPPDHWDWPVDVPYSQGLRCGRYLFVGGQAALDRDGGVLHAGDMTRQTGLTMNYVERVLQEGGASIADLIKLNTLYTDSEDSSDYRQCRLGRDSFFTSRAPASTAVPVDALAYPEQSVEIEAIARLAD